jgi:hypothetical protein
VHGIEVTARAMTMERRNEDTGWKLKRELSIGDILAIIIALVSVLSAYHTLDVRLSIMEKEGVASKERDNDVKRSIEILNQKVDRVLERLIK